MSQLCKGKVEIVGMPLDLGQSVRGTDVGPTAIRYARVVERLRAQGYEITDHGNIDVPAFSKVEPEQLSQVIALVNQQLFSLCCDIHERKSFPLVLGGDHSAVLGSVAASATTGRIGLIWVDAHGDFNTPETSPSGNVHGMPLAALLGRGEPHLTSILGSGSLRAEDVVLVGVRQLDVLEQQALREANIRVFTMRDIDQRGISAVVDEALAVLAHTSRLHLSLDMDALDPHDAPGVGTPVRGGLTYREAHYLMEELAACGRLGAMDVVEINPMLDLRNQTAVTAVDLILSALGQRIL